MTTSSQSSKDEAVAGLAVLMDLYDVAALRLRRLKKLRERQELICKAMHPLTDRHKRTQIDHASKVKLAQSASASAVLSLEVIELLINEVEGELQNIKKVAYERYQ